MTAIARARKARGQSQQDLADVLGVTKRTIQRWEINPQRIPAEAVARLCPLLGLSVDQVLECSPPGPPADLTVAIHRIEVNLAKISTIIRTARVDATVVWPSDWREIEEFALDMSVQARGVLDAHDNATGQR